MKPKGARWEAPFGALWELLPPFCWEKLTASMFSGDIYIENNKNLRQVKLSFEKNFGTKFFQIFFTEFWISLQKFQMTVIEMHLCCIPIVQKIFDIDIFRCMNCLKMLAYKILCIKCICLHCDLDYAHTIPAQCDNDIKTQCATDLPSVCKKMAHYFLVQFEKTVELEDGFLTGKIWWHCLKTQKHWKQSILQ